MDYLIKKLAKELSAEYGKEFQMPLAYTFVGNGEPFFEETNTYIQRLKDAGIPAKLDIYDMDMPIYHK